jgi:hypothetical protein
MWILTRRFMPIHAPRRAPAEKFSRSEMCTSLTHRGGNGL